MASKPNDPTTVTVYVPAALVVKLNHTSLAWAEVNRLQVIGDIVCVAPVLSPVIAAAPTVSDIAPEQLSFAGDGVIGAASAINDASKNRIRQAYCSKHVREVVFIVSCLGREGIAQNAQLLASLIKYLFLASARWLPNHLIMMIEVLPAQLLFPSAVS
jgi:hypothetical protein